MEEKLFLAALHFIGISHKKLFVIFEHHQNYKIFFEKISRGILKQYFFSDQQIDTILERKKICKMDFLVSCLEKRKVKIITFFDKEYPKYLKEIPNRPFLFYLRWHIDNSPKISVVWSRKITSYWKNVIEKIIPELSKYFVIVSGWAAGCDTEAHQICLQSEWKTICVIGTGIDWDYPVWNKVLYDTIVESGWWIVSIFPIGEVWNPYNFPVRNEIVAWLGLGTLVIEAQKKSGTLITAGLALDLWRDLFSIPWDINKLSSEGTNHLIWDGSAKLVMSAADILEEYNITVSEKQKGTSKISFSSNIEKIFYELLILESLTIDEFIHKTQLELWIISSQLSLMEINWLIKKGLGWKYQIC